MQRHTDPGLFGSETNMVHSRLRNPDGAPAVDGRRCRLRHARYGACAPEGVDQSASRFIHSSANPIIATLNQLQSCESRICDNRRIAVDGVMDIDEIRERMAVRGYKQVDLANLLELAPNKVSKAFSGTRRFTIGEMDKIRSWLGDQSEHDTARVRMLPVIGQVAAGSWREAIRSTTDEMPAPDPDMPKAAFALDVVGDSMNNFVPDGGRVIVDPEDKALYPRRFYVVQSGGETTFKRFFADPARLEPCSSNPAHEAITIGGDVAFSIVGRVLWQASRLPD
jgi:repressor LexA